MYRAKHLLTLLVLANWFACLVHCQAEKARCAGITSLQAPVVIQAAAHAPEGDDGCLCDWVATGGCQAPEARVIAPLLLLVAAPAFTAISPLPDLSPGNHALFGEWSTPPPELSGTFLSFCRTAMPVRGPSLAA